MIFQQLSGICIAINYGPTLIEYAGFDTKEIDEQKAAVILSLPLSFVRSLGTFIAISVVDTRGRRDVLLRPHPLTSGYK